MQNTTSDFEEVIRLIGTHYNWSKTIIIDGMTGCRKSTLARAICDELSLDWIEVDSYVSKRLTNESDYSEILCLENIRKSALEAKQLKGGFVLDGVCTQEIINKICMTPDLTIYIDRCDISTKRNVITFCSRLETEPTNSTHRLHVLISKYHKRYRPKSTANIVYTWENRDCEIY
ncbi:hypothetical protein [Fundidesulfovibrio soli]|uniref:hypothetical protein n=1 Tax=Fundidesulfovibrio soli TaxID=2922716 RepID=UPI001FAE7D10|nr:hypothetical protein [Fundidesulfovibrio soli]